MDPVADLQTFAQPHLFWAGLITFAIGLLMLLGIIGGAIAYALVMVLGVAVMTVVVAHNIQH